MKMAIGKAKMSANGRIVIPAAIRRELGLAVGDELTLGVERGRVVIESRANLLRSIQAEVKAAAGDRNLVDELIAERRRTAAREERELEAWVKPRKQRRSSTRQR